MPARLSEAHRLAQARLGAATVRQMVAAFPLLTIEDLDGSFPSWLTVVLPLIRSQRRTSALLAANYMTALRAQSLDRATKPFAPVLDEEIPTDQVATSMLVTGPASIRANLARHIDLDKALDTAMASSAAAAMRLVLNGGRDTIVATVRADRRAAGWARTTSPAACDFCSMLADRGAVYGEDTADFQAHDGCSCSAEPVYR